MIQFDELYRTHKDRIEGFIRRMVRDATLAQDLTQETFLRAQKGLKEFRGEAKPLTWLFRIASNLCLDHLRQKKGRGKMVDFFEYLDDQPPEGVWSSDDDKYNQAVSLEREEMSQCVQEYIERLPESYRAVMVLFYLEDFSIEEIAEILGARSGSVRVRLHRAREELKALLKEGCDFERDERNIFVCTRKEE